MSYPDRYLDLISKYLSNNITLAETDELLRWVDEDSKHADILKEYQEAWERSQLYDSTFEPDIAVAWQKVQGRLNRQADFGSPSAASMERQPGRFKTVPLITYLAAAAALLIFLVAGVWFYRTTGPGAVHIATSNGQQKELLLPDGSRVWLNSGSSITYPEDLGQAGERHVKLSGEAFFEVRSDPEKPFLVAVGATRTRVLGTSFNLKESASGDVSLAVITGRVSFTATEKNAGELILVPGERADYSHKGYLNKSQFNNTNFMYWKDKRLEFDNAEVSGVLKTVGEAYQVEFISHDESLLQKHITTSFENSELTQVLDVLETLLDADINQKGRVYQVKSR